ncbi:expressed unknown protein [Seminavis robusta]|uniref:Uncharacterized protein n=1 Tax=Seminavis robusta TaxID=568900 RepID=A0A9N8E082_9STRA|nr:expressed unknown protein [Seminavis robusta]|eukprot:Sro495_g154400.1 n/a (861) ;mRNA; f:11973-14555
MPSLCEGCGKEFKSRNAVFRHLKETDGACLDADAYRDFHRYVLLQDRKKVLLLYGYLILPQDQEFSSSQKKKKKTQWTNCISNGHDAATKLLDTLEEYIMPPDDDDDDPQQQQDTNSKKEAPKICRAYGNSGRNVDVLEQDDRTGAITEVLGTRLPMIGNKISMDQWLDGINALLDQKGFPMRLLGRLDMPHAKFNAEMDTTFRRVEYLLPADFLLPGQPLGTNDFYNSLPSFVDGFHNHNRTDKVSTTNQPTNDQKVSQMEELNAETSRPNNETLTYLFALKKKMQRLTTKVVELDKQNEGDVLEKNFHKQKRKRQRFKTDHRDRSHNNSNDKNKKNNKKVGNKKNKSGEHASINEDNQMDQEMKDIDDDHGDEDKAAGGKANNKRGKDQKPIKKVLRRRRFHNFTPRSMAHNYFAYRRMDRMYHRATLRFPENVYEEVEQQWQQQTNNPPVTYDRNRPFLAMSISGDLFLEGQTCRVMGVLIALARGLIDDDFVECVFDEDYPHLVPTPEAPPFAMYAAETYYMSWEGKVRKVLTPRKSDVFPEGWNDPSTLRRVSEWQAVIREEIAKAWLFKGIDPIDGRLLEEKRWTKEVLEPWVVQARQQLEEYRQWKRDKDGNSNGNSMAASLPPLSSIDTSVPALYQKVLQCLRDVDSNGRWPTTTPKRQMVMVSTSLESDNNNTGSEQDKKTNGFSSLSMAHMIARNNKLERSSAYEFQEGEGGASGSFSVGAMPGVQCTQPKANTAFPDLMKAAFELERALLPDREPSSTIAINRNAQFRPHTDSGAGSGQSTSLIVAFGNFVGGELVVEGKKEDIRYRPLEFNGWKQRHWTMPFQGERFSLVWFTPKGCEGVHGIDLCRD